MDKIQLTIPGLSELSDQVSQLQEQVRELSNNQFSSRWLDNQEFCKLLGISTRTAQNYRDRGMISFSQIGPKIYYLQEDIEIFLERHKVKAFYAKSA